MKRKSLTKHLLFCISILLISCKNSEQLADYEALKNMAIQKNNLYQTVYEYDIEHPDFFESKVELVSLCILNNDFENANDFIKRAEVLLKNRISKEYLCNFYGLKASILMNEGNYEESLASVRKANAMKGKVERYSFLEGQILFAKGEKSNSLTILKRAFENSKKDASLEDEKLYALLLAENEEFDESLMVMNEILEEGNYWYGLGQLLSSVYEKKGMLFESILCAFMDYEYASDFFHGNDDAFLKNLNILKLKYAGKKESREVNEAVEIIAANLKNSNYLNSYSDSDFFIFKYLKTKNKILAKLNGENELENLLTLKKYFSMFPSFHYLVAESISNQKGGIVPLECYETILEISPSNKYSDYARIMIGKSIGLNENNSKKLLSFSEIKKLIGNSVRNKSEKEFSLIFDLLSLPDNKYVFFAQEILKSNLRLENILKTVTERYMVSDGRLKERLNYVLYQ